MSLNQSNETEEEFSQKIEAIDDNFVVVNYAKKEVLCKACYIKYIYYSDIHLRLHIMSQEHINNTKKNSNTLEDTEFQTDLAVALSGADISLDVLNNPVFKAFIEKYCNKEIPDDLEKTMNENYKDLFDKARKRTKKLNQNICVDCYDFSSDDD